MIEVSICDDQDEVLVETSPLVDLAQGVLLSEGVEGPAELSLCFVDEDSMAELNAKYRGIDAPTDVLSFSIDGHPGSGDGDPGSPDRSPEETDTRPGSVDGHPGGGADGIPAVLGDVVICPAVAARNARAHGMTVNEELSLLVVHGVLHLLGMDHEDLDEAEAMETREDAHLAAHGKSA